MSVKFSGWSSVGFPGWSAGERAARAPVFGRTGGEHEMPIPGGAVVQGHDAAVQGVAVEGSGRR